MAIKIPLSPSPQAVITTLIIASAYVTNVVIMSLDKNFRDFLALGDKTVSLMNIVGGGLLHLALALAMFLVPLKMGGKLELVDYMGWSVAVLAVAYSCVYLYTTITNYRKWIKVTRGAELAGVTIADFFNLSSDEFEKKVGLAVKDVQLTLPPAPKPATANTTPVYASTM